MIATQTFDPGVYAALDDLLRKRGLRSPRVPFVRQVAGPSSANEHTKGQKSVFSLDGRAMSYALSARGGRLRSLLGCILMLFAASLPATAGAVETTTDPRCAQIDERVGYGPYDYRERHGKRRQNLGVVQKYHFTAKQQRDILRGRIDHNNWNELDYVLRAFPNHAPALYLLGLYEQKIAQEHKEYYETLKRREFYAPTACYFQRAMRFAPDDPNVWNTLGRLHTQAGRHDEAIKAFAQVVKMAPKSAAAHYNLGLALFAAGKYEEAADSAKKAYAFGYPRKDLAQRLASKGHW